MSTKQHSIVAKILKRSEQRETDTWDLTKLFSNSDAWTEALSSTVARFQKFSAYEGSITPDATTLLPVFEEYYQLNESLARLGAYASLLHHSDITNTTHQEVYATFVNQSVLCHKASVFFEQELLSLAESFLTSLISDVRFESFAQKIREIIQRIPHRLSKNEEKLLALQSGYAHGFSQSFDALVDADMKFGTVVTPDKKEVPISHGNFRALMQHEVREVRKAVYEKYFTTFAEHLQVLSTLYTSSIKQDNALAEIRKYNSALEAALTGDRIPTSLYHLLISTVRENLPQLHRYYEVLHSLSQLSDFAIYDRFYCPIPAPNKTTTYESAVEILRNALQPLGEDYVNTLCTGLLSGRWVDRYENVGKSSGAFSYPIYQAPPYILMNYQEESLRDVFTLAHESGHSMHSQLSSQQNAFPNFHYSIFCAEIASTINEYLLYQHLIDNAKSDEEKKFYLWHKTSDFVSTFFRQTMFAEFEHNAHTKDAQGVPLTAQFFLSQYRELCSAYYGKHIIIPENNAIEGLRIPHFYRNYYVYQYATGIATAFALGKRIYKEYQNASTIESQTAKKYRAFLECGGADFPLSALARADIHFDTSAVLQSAIDDFSQDVEMLNSL